MQKILINDDKAKKFIGMINQVSDVTDYLAYRVRQDKTKYDLIKVHGQEYKQKIFKASSDFLFGESLSQKSENDFLDSLGSATQAFEKSALNIDRSFFSKALKVVVNGLLHITGLYLIVNTIHEAATGDWFVLNKTRSTDIIRQASGDIKISIREFNRIKEAMHAIKTENNPDQAESSANIERTDLTP